MGNAVDATDKLVNTTEKTLVPTTSGASYSSAVLTAFGSSLAVGYGQKGPQSNSAYAAVRLVDPATGQTSGTAALGANEGQAVLPLAGGIAATNALSSIALGSRLTNAGAVAGRVSRFGATPTFVTSASPTSSTFALDVAWNSSASRFGAAFVESGGSTGGKLVTYDETFGSTGGFAFTGAGDQPAFGAAYPPSVAGQGARFVVAWVDLQSGIHDVYLTSVDALSGARSPATSVKASDTPASFKYYPRVLWDGRSVVVAWVEQASTLYHVVWRRFDPSFVPLGPSQCASCAIGPAVLGQFGLASLGPNQYGLAMLESDNYQYFAHIGCTGP